MNDSADPTSDPTPPAAGDEIPAVPVEGETVPDPAGTAISDAGHASPDAPGAGDPSPVPSGDGQPPVAVPVPVEVAPVRGEVGAGAAISEPVRRQNQAAAVGLAAVLVVLALGAGIAIGRATAPGSDAATSLPSVAVVPGGSPSVAPGASPDASGDAAPTAVAGLPAEGNRLGRADAKVVVDYWADYQCPFCAKFAQEIIPQLNSRIADGTIALVHRDFAFLGPESLDAAIAVRCASREGRYWEMHDAVYAAQQGENQGAFARERLAQVAAGVGLDAQAFEACMDDRAALIEVLDDTSAGTRAGISSTPTVDVNGNRFPGVSDVAALLAAIDAAAAGASPAPTAPPPALNDPWSGVTTSGREAGEAGAPVTVELWVDYQDANYKGVAETLETELRTRVGDGSVRVVQRDLATLGEESVLAASTVRCIARQDGPAWLAHDAMALSARGANSGMYNERALLWFAAKLGLDVPALGKCLEDPAVAAEVKAETAAGTADGLAAAPAVIVRKGDEEVARFTGALDTEKVLAAIDGAR